MENPILWKKKLIFFQAESEQVFDDFFDFYEWHELFSKEIVNCLFERTDPS